MQCNEVFTLIQIGTQRLEVLEFVGMRIVVVISYLCS